VQYVCVVVTGNGRKLQDRYMKYITGTKNKRQKFNRPDKMDTGHEYDPIHELMEVLLLSFSSPTYSKLRRLAGGGGGGGGNRK
jgi:hypothetical protein